MSYLGDTSHLGQLPVGWDWKLREEHCKAVAGFVLQPKAVLPLGRPISMDNQFHVQKILLEDRLAVGTLDPGEMISIKKKNYYPTLERQDESDQEKTIASQNFI